MARGLLGRLAAGNRQPRGGQAELISVLENLRALFNTHHGDSAACPDFGVPDLTDCLHDFPNGTRPLRQHLQDAILRYEPRLTEVAVQFTGLSENGLTIHFEVHGRLASDPNYGVRFGTRVTRGSHFLVDG